MHERATDEAEYTRVFGADVTFHYGADHNALTFDRSLLDAPMLRAHPSLQAAYEHRVRQCLDRVPRSGGVEGVVRESLQQLLPRGDLSLNAVSARLGMSPATLRRRLLDEQTTFTDVLDDVRKKLAEQHLADLTLAISEVAFLLGFSHVAAFYKAFRRWSHGTTPAAFRSALRKPGRVAIG